MASNYNSPFLFPEYKAFCLKLISIGATATCIVKFSDGTTKVCGNAEIGIEGCKKKLEQDKRCSGEWVPPAEKFTVMDKPLADIVKNQNAMKKYANITVKHFIGTNVAMGTGENIMWDTAVNFERMKYTRDAIKNKWNSPVISLSDVIEWKNFQVKSFGTKLDNKYFKI